MLVTYGGICVMRCFMHLAELQMVNLKRREFLKVSFICFTEDYSQMSSFLDALFSPESRLAVTPMIKSKMVFCSSPTIGHK